MRLLKTKCALALAVIGFACWHLDVAFAAVPALIGGVRITVGSDVYDSSVRGRLAGLEDRFSNHNHYDHPARGT